jgi:hypothetical protein
MEMQQTHYYKTGTATGCIGHATKENLICHNIYIEINRENID